MSENESLSSLRDVQRLEHLGIPFPRRHAIWEFDFDNLSYEWRRLFSEILGTFLLVFVAAGAGTISAFSHVEIGRAAAVVAPGLMVMAIILFMGTISGAHLNPVVTLAFALRKEFPWKRVPAYLVAQIVGAVLACLVLFAMFGRVGDLGATLPGLHVTEFQATIMEIILTLGLVSTILGTSSGAQNVGSLSAVAVGGYIALAGLFSSPISGASMNPFRSLGPDLVLGNYSDIAVYLIGPTVGAILAVLFAIILRGKGGDLQAARAAQGTLEPVLVKDGAHDEIAK